MTEREEIAQIAQKAAELAGDLLRQRFGTIFRITQKKDAGLLTEVDLEVEEMILNSIRNVRPHDAILAEESGVIEDMRGESGFRWIIDPLDGTTNFAHGVPHFAVSIGVEFRGELIVGVINNPIANEMFITTKGGGVTLNGDRKGVSGSQTLEESLIATGFSYRKGEIVDREVAVLHRVLHQVRAIRRFGSAALDLCYVAVGRFDGFWEYDLSPWDVAAGVLMVQEAGGEVTTMNGGKYLLNAGSIIASNGKIHHSLLEFLS